MLSNKHIVKIITAVMSVSVVLCLVLLMFSDKLTASASEGISMEYEDQLFNTDSIISINIIMDEDEWNEMLENATDEEYYECDVEINGETFYRVGIRPKGNTSLTSIANDPTTDRYSFKLEFDHYVDGQTCYGLDKLILNNNYSDATNMKEALIYDMFKFIGADASLYNYASISLNGTYKGVYLALEGVEDSFCLRNYGTQNGTLYKPESTENGGGMAGSGTNGANLNYSDDDSDSYSTIWDGAISDITSSDKKRVITALKNISLGNDLESYMDIDNLLRYMAVHVFSVNEDSLSGNMAHNYYLYESGGMLNLIPWDYNLCLGGMNGGTDATSLVNDPIDNAFSGTDFFDTLLENDDYNSQYYAYLKELVTEYIDGGGFDAFYTRVRSQIDELVENDPTAFYTYSEYEEAADTLYQIVKLRGESILGQVDEKIPSTAEEQENSDSLIDASNLDVTVMGVMNSGEMQNGGGDMAKLDMTSTDEVTDDVKGASTTDIESSNSEESSNDQTEDNANNVNGDDNNFNAKGGPNMGDDAGQNPPDMQMGNNDKPFDNANEDFGGDFEGKSSEVSDTSSKSYMLTCGIAILIMTASLIFAVCYKRRPRKR